MLSVASVENNSVMQCVQLETIYLIKLLYKEKAKLDFWGDMGSLILINFLSLLIMYTTICPKKKLQSDFPHK